MEYIISAYCVIFFLGGSIYGSERDAMVKIVPPNVVLFYYSLVENGMDPDEAAVKALKIAASLKKGEEKAK